MRNVIIAHTSSGLKDLHYGLNLEGAQIIGSHSRIEHEEVILELVIETVDKERVHIKIIQ